MERLNWIESAGGPLVMISDNDVELWSGIYNKDSYLCGKFDNAEDFMDPKQTDYGQACSVDNYLGLVEKENCLVFGDEPMPTTVFKSTAHEINIARFYYYGIKDSEHTADEFLADFDLALIDNWEYILTVTFDSKKQLLFDAAVDGKKILQNQEGVDFLLSHLTPGEYKVFTAIYEPNEAAKLILHRLIAS